MDLIVEETCFAQINGLFLRQLLYDPGGIEKPVTIMFPKFDIVCKVSGYPPVNLPNLVPIISRQL